MDYQALFHANPSVNPYTGQQIEIGGPIFLRLVDTLGWPPETALTQSAEEVPIETHPTLANMDQNIFEVLPLELIHEILISADLETFSRLCNTNKTFYRLCKDVRTLREVIARLDKTALNRVLSQVYTLFPEGDDDKLIYHYAMLYDLLIEKGANPYTRSRNKLTGIQEADRKNSFALFSRVVQHVDVIPSFEVGLLLSRAIKKQDYRFIFNIPIHKLEPDSYNNVILEISKYGNRKALEDIFNESLNNQHYRIIDDLELSMAISECIFLKREPHILSLIEMFKLGPNFVVEDELLINLTISSDFNMILAHFLEKDLKINDFIGHPSDRVTLLSFAFRSRSRMIIELLLHRGADVTLYNSEIENSALGVVITTHNTEYLLQLLKLQPEKILLYAHKFADLATRVQNRPALTLLIENFKDHINLNALLRVAVTRMWTIGVHVLIDYGAKETVEKDKLSLVELAELNNSPEFTAEIASLLSQR
jgi:2-cysteine adaptor domain.